MAISEIFFSPRYDDAPWLSDQLLLPNLVRGHSIHVVSAFAPSYIFKLVEDLAESEEIEPGFLNIVFFVPGDLSIRSQAIARFKKYLGTYVNDWELAKFVGQCLQLLKEGREHDFGGIQIHVQHTSQKKPLTKSLIGVIVDPEQPEQYATFVDAKGGDFNSPVQIRKSWVEQERLEAQEVLGAVVKAHDTSNARASLVSPTEVEEWLIYLHNFFEENPPINPAVASVIEEPLTEDDEEDLEEDDAEDQEFLEHLQSLEEFEDEDQYGWFDDDDDYDIGPVNFDISGTRLAYGHVPPLDEVTAMLIGPDRIARCVCGEKFYRAQGCDQVMWDPWDVMRVPEYGEWG